MWHCSRRLGKSYLLVDVALEYAIQHPQWPVRYVAPTRVGLKQIIHPIFRDIIADCPPELRPVWNSSENQYVLPGGGIVHLSGVNNGHEDDARGTAAGLAIIDEAGFIDNLEYVVKDVLMPQTINTGGFLILSSSSPKTPAHDFVGFIHEAQQNDSYSIFDIHQAGYPQDIVDEFCKEAGGEKSSTWQREYLCKLVVDETAAIVPEWDDKYIQEWPKDEYFQFYTLYEAMDVGGRDKNAVLFSYYDFKAAKLIIEDEYILEGPRMTTQVIADGVRAVEKRLWGSRAVGTRIADNNNVILLNDLQHHHGLNFFPTSKDDLSAMVNELRLWVQQGRIILHPRCRETAACLRYGIWDERRKEFARSRAFGHFDALAALIYKVRNIDQHSNPIPSHYGKKPADFWLPPTQQASEEDLAWTQAFRPVVPKE